MNPELDPLTQALTGGIFLVLLLAVALAAALSALFLLAYRRSVVRLQSLVAPGAPGHDAPAFGRAPPAPAPPPPLAIVDSTSGGEGGGDLVRRARRAVLLTAAVYSLAGLAYAAILAGTLLQAAEIELLPGRFILLAWTFAWPIVLTLNRVAAVGRKMRSGLLFGYFALLVALMWSAVAVSPEVGWSGVAVVWLLYNGIPTLFLLGFLNRRVQAVGPLVLILTGIAVAGAVGLLALAASSDALIRLLVDVGDPLGLGPTQTIVAVLLTGFLAAGAGGGYLAARWIGRRYEDRRISDQSITADATWLLFTITYSTGFVFEGPAWILAALGAFVAYKLLVRLGFALVGRVREPGAPAPRLLLLRVFALGRRSQRLYDALTLYWRHVGRLHLIAGPDLATSTIEPDEFFAYLRGRLRHLFIDRPETLDQRLAAPDGGLDRDGRHRVQEFFCSGPVWKTALVRLAGEGSDVVLMDLRSFSATNAGCLFEIEALVNLVPLERVLFLAEDQREAELLREKMHEFWARMSPESPNAKHPPGRITLFRSSGSVDADLATLLRLLERRAMHRPQGPGAGAAPGAVSVPV